METSSLVIGNVVIVFSYTRHTFDRFIISNASVTFTSCIFILLALKCKEVSIGWCAHNVTLRKVYQPSTVSKMALKYLAIPASESCKTISSVDDPSEKDSLSHFQSDHDETKGSPLKPDIYVDDLSSEEDDDESSHSVEENSKESPPKSGIFFEEPPSEVESNHSSVHEDSNGSSLKSGIYVDNPSEKDNDESSHSVQEN
ncbi:hypothetical protein EMCRGX_G020642 [Ephydatia muelleri]